MDNREKVIEGLESVKETLEIERDNQGVTWVANAIALLKAQGEEIEELKQEIEGHKDNLRETLDEMMRYADELKAHESRVMTLEEIKALPDYVFLEDRDISHAFSIKTISRPALPQLVFVNISGEERVGFRGPDGDTSLVISRYGVEWRCWTSRPTDEQREEAKWK